MKIKKLRLVLTLSCNRHCDGCCNNQWDWSKVHVFNGECGVKFSSNAIPPFQSVNTRAELQMLRSKCRRLYAALR